MLFDNVPDKSRERLLEYFGTHFDDDDTRTQRSELLAIIEEEGDFFPFCHAFIGVSFLGEPVDLEKAHYHIEHAINQDQYEVLALCGMIELCFAEVNKTRSSASNVIKKTSWIPYLGTFSALTGVATAKVVEGQMLNKVCKNVDLICSSLPRYLTPALGPAIWSFIGNVIISIEDEIRSIDSLYSRCGRIMPKVLYCLPWNELDVDSEDKSKFDKLLRDIRAATR